MQQLLFDQVRHVKPLRTQLLKWIGNKQRFAHEIVSYFPADFNRYHEPFLGSGAVLATLRHKTASASDIFPSLVEIWRALHDSPDTLKDWYSERWKQVAQGEKVKEYEAIKASYNKSPNGADLLFLCRSCYGGVVRFRKADGYMSTPCGVHAPIHPDKFAKRVDIWHERTRGTDFSVMDYQDAMPRAKEGDLIYCDPPYSHSQGILYGAQSFDIRELFEIISHCKKSGVYVALSIDGKKMSGRKVCELSIPDDLFERQIFVNCGPSMLKRFQMQGRNLDEHHVADRLLLTY
ncbi:MAG: DNA adenine methylase [Phycisphaerae bacterium]|nr:DNA adenine methylase [Phycisphaerae bacterium]